MLRRSLLGASIAIVPLLAASACGTSSPPSGFGTPPSGADGGTDTSVPVTFDATMPPPLMTPDGAAPTSPSDSGWTELPDGAWTFSGDSGGWVAEPDGGWEFGGDAGGWTELPDGGWTFTGDGGGWVELPDGGWAFEGDGGGWTQEPDGGWVYDGGPTGDGSTCVNLQCQQGTCGDGGSATITGHIYDPAGNNPLYKVVAYVPNTDPSPITDGITSDSCSCDSLFTGTPVASGITGADGVFTITNAPVGANIPIVIQIGKWRNYFVIPNVACGTNDLDTMAGMSKLTLPKTQSETKFSNLPNIAVSTGSADSLECLLERVGVSASEYTGTPGGTAGHIHIFQGGKAGATGPNTKNPAGPASYTSLWDSQADINRYDVVLLSCEGADTYKSNSPVLAQYVNSGGRVFASHYHYAFFVDDTTNTPATDFPNVADWTYAYDAKTQIGGTDAYGTATNASVNAAIQTTLPNGNPFPEGQALYTW
ncbi:MAG TPA: hypothetical protein VGI39_34610, partial [Polyangiaceae bacterium]